MKFKEEKRKVRKRENCKQEVVEMLHGVVNMFHEVVEMLHGVVKMLHGVVKIKLT